MTYGWYKLIVGIREQKFVLPFRIPSARKLANKPTHNSELAREKMWSRINLIPALQAEEDRDLVRRHLADQAREKELLGENFKVYNSDRYVLFLYIAQYLYFTIILTWYQICPPNIRGYTHSDEINWLGGYDMNTQKKGVEEPCWLYCLHGVNGDEGTEWYGRAGGLYLS